MAAVRTERSVEALVTSVEGAWLARGAAFVETLALTSCCIASLLVGTVMSTAVAVLSRLDGANSDISLDALRRGQLGGLFTGPTLWESYPAGASLAAFWNGFAALTVLVLIGMVMRTGWQRRWRPSTIGVSLLVLGAVPYGWGAAVLAGGDLSPERCGPWVAVMILGMLYSSCASGCWCAVHLALHALPWREITSLRPLSPGQVMLAER